MHDQEDVRGVRMAAQVFPGQQILSCDHEGGIGGLDAHLRIVFLQAGEYLPADAVADDELRGPVRGSGLFKIGEHLVFIHEVPAVGPARDDLPVRLPGRQQQEACAER